MDITTVIHPNYGRGQVLATRASGFELRVRFAGGRERWIRRDQVEREAAPAAPACPQQAAKPEQHAKPKAPRYSRRVIEALRMGIVPDAEVANFTFGRDQETADLNAWLDDRTDSARFIVGSYGTGKTHLLNYLRTTALQAGYAVALVEMDGLESPFSRPKRAYSQVIQNLEVPVPEKQTPQRFRDLIRRIRRADLLSDHPYFKYIQAHTGDDYVWHWIEGREDVPRPRTSEADYRDLPGLYNHGTAANIYCNLLSALGWACRHPRIGLKGLLLIFDESETLFARATYTASKSSYNFLESLIAVANNAEGMTDQPTTTGFEHSRYASDVPFQYRDPSGLKVALAFTDISDLRCSSTLYDVDALYLESLGDDALISVFEQIRSLYRKAYRFDTERLPLDTLYDRVIWQPGTTRLKIKGYVEALDLMRFYPQSEPNELLV